MEFGMPNFLQDEFKTRIEALLFAWKPICGLYPNFFFWSKLKRSLTSSKFGDQGMKSSTKQEEILIATYMSAETSRSLMHKIGL